MSSDEHPSFLVVIIDAKGSAWKNQDQLASDLKIRKEDFIKSLLIFLNSYILLNRRNHLLVISRNSYSSKTVFPPLELSSSSKQEFIPTPDVVMRSIIESVFEESSSSVGRKSSIAQALSKAMCVLNRNLTERPQLQGRVLVAQISSDLADTYNQMMNSIFR